MFLSEDLIISFSSAGTKIEVFFSTGNDFSAKFSSEKGSHWVCDAPKCLEVPHRGTVQDVNGFTTS